MPRVLIEILICAAAGMCAGLSTGFAGLSAAVFIVPFLHSFLGVDFVEAVAISLASDVLGSLISTIIFKKAEHVKFRKSLPLFIPIVIATIGGSILSIFLTQKSALAEDISGFVTIVGSLALGLGFIIKPIKALPEKQIYSKRRILIAVLFGLLVGFICGYQGAGGGVMMLVALTLIMHYEFKTAVGTSVLIMTITAAIGAITHYAAFSFKSVDFHFDWIMFVTCVISTGLFAFIASKIANKIKPETLNRITGVMIVLSSLATLIFKIIQITAK